MGFYKVLERIDTAKIWADIMSTTEEKLQRIMMKDKMDFSDITALLSPEADGFLENLAQRSRKESLKHFGRAVLLYTPIYISNYCVNRCLYCSFNVKNSMDRDKLSYKEIEEEAQSISETGIKHILILTGESEFHTSREYIRKSISILKRYFDSVSLEVYPMDEEAYSDMVEAGADGVTVYQETYDKEIYEKVHVSGPKRDFKYRLETPERACKAGVRSINMGALLGLADWRIEVYKLALHLQYISKEYPDVELGISLPRIKEIHSTEKQPFVSNTIRDREFVQIMLVLKNLFPHMSINMSTRESSDMRRNLIPLGINKMSAGVSTSVGGHSVRKGRQNQFEISDESSVKEVKELITSVGYQPVMKDWMHI